MRIGIFSDVHGNIEALEVVLQALKYENVDRTICLGDVVGYGPNPNQCVDKIIEEVDHVIAGNHDYAAIGQVSTQYFNEYARQAIDWTQDVLTSTSVHFLSQLPLIHIEEEITFVHATPEAPEEWHYIFTNDHAYRNFHVLETSVCFVGHSHTPVAFVLDENEDIAICNATEISIIEGKKYIINEGSVGQPRDGDPRACYGILDTHAKRFHLQRLSYPVDQVQEKMWKEHLPSYLIHRLAVGL